MNLTPERFTEFFRAVHEDERGHAFDPFPWQQRLAARVASHNGEFRGSWPRCLALPTGSGKTTAVDIAVFALACQTSLPLDERTAPRRIIFIVDRRLIVDEAFDHSVALARKLRDALHDRKGGILLEVAQSLRSLAGGDALQKLLPREMLSRARYGSNKGDLLPLTCHQLRGSIYRDDAWARTPLQPCVIASTVDQIGSRLLFRGYGCSFKSRTIHAGLAANDSLIILDEAHCAQPFMETLQSVQKYRDRCAEQRIGGPFQFAIMSATPPVGTGELFNIEPSDRKNKYLGRRITATKPTTLVPSKAKGSKAHSELALDLVAHAATLMTGPRRAIAILVNRVPTANFCHTLLTAALDLTCNEIRPFTSKTLRDVRNNLPKAFDVALMTGRMRPADKTTVTEQWLRRLSATSSDERELEKPVIVIATQCLEVGANLDFDGIVSECASFDALRQRFGRLNRAGRNIPAKGVITIRADQVSETNEDPIYGLTLAATWRLLNEHATNDSEENSVIDFGIDPMDALWRSLTSKQQDAIVPESKHAPVMLPAHLDMWCQTSPEPEPSPDPAIFLHGPDEGRPDVQVCWRADIEDHSGRRDELFAERTIDAISMTPPTSMECLSVPLVVFRRWLAARTNSEQSSSNDELSDASAGSAATEEAAIPRHTAVIWRGRESQLVTSTREIRPGDTIVLPVTAEGWDVFGHIPPEISQHTSIDIGDRCYIESRARASIRLSPTLVAQWFGIDPLYPEATNSLEEPTRKLIGLLQDVNEPLVPVDLFSVLKEIAASERLLPHANWLRAALPSDAKFRWYRWSKPLRVLGRANAECYWQVGLRGKASVSPRDEAERDRLELTRGDASTGDDEVDSSTGRVTISEHTNGVIEFARTFATQALPGDPAEAYEIAARLHDLGKADSRFQTFLFSGDSMQASLHADNPLAKSAGLNDVIVDFHTAWNRSGLPDGSRHEMLSLQLAEAIGLVPADDLHRDLILHLIATHHGYARPFAPICVDPDTEPLEFHWNLSLVEEHPDIGCIRKETRNQWVPPHRLDSGVTERFWKLVRRYGWWGLAWLESVFILADRRCSEAEQCEKANDTPDEAEQKEICV